MVSPLRVLILTTRYPDAVRTRLGEVSARQATHLARVPGVEVKVMAPIAFAPFPLDRLPAWQAIRALPASEWKDDIEVMRLRYAPLPLVPGHEATALASRAIPVLRRLRARFPFDVILADYAWPEWPAAMRIGEALDAPFVGKARGPELTNALRIPRQRERLRKAAGKAATLLAVSSATRDEILSLGVREHRVRVHYTGVDRERFRCGFRESAKAELRLAGPVVLTAGVVCERKGQIRAVEAMRLVPGATLLIAGRGPDEGRIRERVRELEMSDRVRFLGLVPHEQMPLLNAAADVAILASTKEGLANVWVEALASGTPVVTPDVGGAREAIDRPAAGRIVGASPEELAAGVRSLLASPPPPSEVAAAAAKFSWTTNAEELAHTLRESIAAQR